MCLHGALCFVPFILISNTTTFSKNVLTFDHSPGVEGVYKDRICACMVIYTPFLLI